MANHILLVEPAYYSKFPPIGLLKLSAYHKQKGDTTELINFEKRDQRTPKKTPKKIYVTSLFTWARQPVWDAVAYYKTEFPEAEVWLGGIYASLLPDHAKLSGADRIYRGLFEEAENIRPDYDLVPDWDGSIIFSSRGCCNKCPFCAVPRLEGKMNSLKKSIRPFVLDQHSKIIFFDNNFLANKYRMNIFKELSDYDKKVDFNQGIDARLISEPIAKKIASLTLDPGVRIAYDSHDQQKYVKKAVDHLIEAGIKKRDIFVYSLFNYTDTPDEFFTRVRDILNWGIVCYPMRYESLFTIEKNSYISPLWDIHKIQLVQQARRVIGYGGAFPAYEGLVNKFNKASGFEEAFGLYPEKNGEVK
ncbi:MAG: hypothetical protein ABFC89_13060 [Methanospirillum sp.]